MAKKSSQPKRSLRLGFYFAINLLILAVLLEVGARIVYPKMRGPEFSWVDTRARLAADGNVDAVIAGDPRASAGEAPPVVLHPYLGYVFAPGSALTTRNGEELRYSEFGFFGDEPVFEKAEDEIVVAIGGGSVAAGLWHRGGDTIRAALQQHPAFAGKTIRLQSFALGGFKQPQLLHTLTHLMSIGAAVDVWIELDGFNELVLPLAENAPAGVPVSYPRNWQRLARAGVSGRELALRAEIHAAQEQRARRAEAVRGVWAHSAFIVACWNEADRRAADQIAALVQSLAEEGTAQATPAAPDVLNESMEVWKASSIQMARICAANGIRYFQFIQPNQYFPGTKPLSDEEMRTAVARGGYRPAAESGYSLLVQAGEELRAAGVPIFDLTTLFQDEPRTLYSDTCCHLNALGNELLAERIAVTILESFAEATP